MIEDVYSYLKYKFKNVRSELLKSSTVTDFIDEYGKDIGFKQYDYGSSKLVLFFQELDMIVKIPLFGPSPSKTYIGSISDCEWDYCQYESIVYEKAIQANIEQMFASTIYLGNVGVKDDIPIYVSEKVYETVDEENQISCSLEDVDCAIEDYNHWSDIGDLCSLCELYRYYGAEKFNILFDFLIDNCVNDLRYSNLGYREDGSIVLIDYSGWYD